LFLSRVVKNVVFVQECEFVGRTVLFKTIFFLYLILKYEDLYKTVIIISRMFERLVEKKKKKKRKRKKK